MKRQGRRWARRPGTASHDVDHTHGAKDGHSHGVSAEADRRYLLIALGLLAGFMLGEVVVAVVSGSLALLSDAGHMLSDVGAIGAALWAIRLAARPAAGAWTFGWKRAEILSAAGNGITLLVVSGIVTAEAIRRLIHPPHIAGRGVRPPPAEPGIEYQARQHGGGQDPVHHRDPALGSQHRVIQRPAGHGLA